MNAPVHQTGKGKSNQSIEPMTRSADRFCSESGAIAALLVMAHARR